MRKAQDSGSSRAAESAPDTSTPQRAHYRRSGQTLTAEERKQAQDKFLKAFASSANVAASCREAHIDRSTVYLWLEHDEQFSMRYHLAEQDAADVVRAAIQRRGISGWEEPVVSMGKIVRNDDGTVLTVRKYSDACLLALAKARVPEFKDKLDLTSNGQTILADLAQTLASLREKQHSAS